jgi:hypothetical protein
MAEDCIVEAKSGTVIDIESSELAARMVAAASGVVRLPAEPAEAYIKRTDRLMPPGMVRSIVQFANIACDYIVKQLEASSRTTRLPVTGAPEGKQ